jgi:DNA-binding NarL/FixJ family response regulator
MPSPGYRPGGGRRLGVDVAGLPSPALVGATSGPMLRTLSGVAEAPRALAPEMPDAGGQVRWASRDSTAGAGEPGVTTEELAILVLMANGLTLDSVALRVSLSPRTLSRRLRCVCDRLGVAHPIQAIVWAARRGLL